MKYILRAYRHLMLWFIIHALFLNTLDSQDVSPFDELPVLPSLQGQALNVFPDENEIYIVGHLLLDTLLEPPWQIVKPFFAVFDYDGSLVNHFIVETDDSLMYYRILHRPIYVQDGFAYIYFDKISYIEPTGYPELLEIDIQAGSITRRFSKSENPFNEVWVGVDGYTYNEDKSVISYNYLDGGRLFIRKVDSTFTLVDEFVVEENGRLNAPFYIDLMNDTSYVLVGASVLKGPTGDFIEIKPFFMTVHRTGKIDQFNLFPGMVGTHIQPSCGTCFSYLRDSNENWFLANSTNLPPELCQSCAHDVPVVSLMSSDFSSVIWTNYFSPRPLDTAQYFIVKSSDIIRNNSGFVVAGFDITENPWSSFLVKFNLTGQRMWYRTFLPSAWEQDSGRVVWGIMEDVKSTPHGTFVMVGNAYDGYEQIRRPWLLHVDSMGCLIPGCHEITGTETEPTSERKWFKVAPNPSSGMLYLQFQGTPESLGQTTVQLVDMGGSIVRSGRLDITSDTQYIFSIETLPPGQYFLILESKDHTYRQVEPIIRQ